MSIETKKLELMQLLLQTQEKSLLDKIKKLFDEERSDWWDTLSEAEQREIKIGIEQANKNQFSSHENVMKRFDEWR